MESPVRVVHSAQISYVMPQPELPLGQREDPRHSMMGCWGLCHHWPLRFQVVLTAASLSMGYHRLWIQVLVRVRRHTTSQEVIIRSRVLLRSTQTYLFRSSRRFVNCPLHQVEFSAF